MKDLEDFAKNPYDTLKSAVTFSGYYNDKDEGYTILGNYGKKVVVHTCTQIPCSSTSPAVNPPPFGPTVKQCWIDLD